MTARRDPASVVDASARLLNASIDAWASNARAMAANLESGTYSPSDWFSGAVNSSASLCRVAYEWLESVVTGRIVEPAQSDEYKISRRSPGTRVLELVGPLQATMPPIVTIDPSRVHIRPPQLAGSDDRFHLDVDATGCRGDAYIGSVRVWAGRTVEQTITVVVQVP